MHVIEIPLSLLLVNMPCSMTSPHPAEINSFTHLLLSAGAGTAWLVRLGPLCQSGVC